jgi:hypothetical protein
MSKAPKFISNGHPAVRPILKRSVPLPAFLARAAKTKQLNPAGRRRLVEQALVLLEGFYVHLPQKRAMYAVEPVHRLKLLLNRLSRIANDIALYRELIDIFTSVRDFHTRFELPPPYAGAVAYLPFMIEECYRKPGSARQYIVSSLVEGFAHPSLRAGVEVTHWNGIPIERAVELVAADNPGGNDAARHARGLNRLTVRPMLRSLPPDGEWVTIGYRTGSGAGHEYRADWLVLRLPDANAALAISAHMAELGLDAETDAIRNAKKILFAPHVVAAEAKQARRKQAMRRMDLASALPDVFEARAVPTQDGELGYLRIRTFVKNPASLVSEFLRLIEALPQDGLIIDVRDNGGGQISAGEQLLQLLAPRTITPEGAQFISTELTRQLCRLNAPSRAVPGVNLSPWLASLGQALETGAAFSGVHPITDPAACNFIGQRYYGPVVLVTNALCYSATDIFTAGFHDHRIGIILGTDGNTGAGGANPFDHSLLRTLFSRKGRRNPVAGSPLQSLPNGPALHVAMRRTVRVGAQSGTLLEDLGVVPDQRHWMTREDVLNRNVDLIECAARLLAPLPRYGLAPAPPAAGATALDVTTRNITRLDVLLDDRPAYSGKVKDGSNALPLGTPLRAAARLELRGYKGAQLVAARKLEALAEPVPLGRRSRGGRM